MAAFYALSVNQTALPSDKTYAQQLKAAAILEPIFKELPDHPGAAHYLIHAYDHPALAERALPAARSYAKIAPDAPHALHMPSHTFTRVGYWQDSIDTNRASAEAARKANSAAEMLHALDYQVYAYLQTAQDRAAHDVIGELAKIVATVNTAEQYGQVGVLRGGVHPGPLRARARAVEGSGGAEGADDGVPVHRRDHALRPGRRCGAKRQCRRGERRRAEARGSSRGAGREEGRVLGAAGRHPAEGGWRVDRVRGTAQGRSAASRCRRPRGWKTRPTSPPSRPGPLAPARELLGEMLLEMKRPKEALTELEAVMKKEPNRFRTLYLGARAASAAGDQAKAKKYYADLVKMCAAGDGDRPELLEARKQIWR